MGGIIGGGLHGGLVCLDSWSLGTLGDLLFIIFLGIIIIGVVRYDGVFGKEVLEIEDNM